MCLVVLLPTFSTSLKSLRSYKGINLFAYYSKHIRFQILFTANSCNMLWHHQFLSAASATSHSDSCSFCPLMIFLAAQFSPLFLCVHCLLSFLLHCWIPHSLTEKEFSSSPMYHPFSLSSKEACSSLTNVSFCSFCYRFKVNCNRILSPSSSSPQPPLSLKIQQDTVLAITHTQAWRLLFNSFSNCLYPSSIENSDFSSVMLFSTIKKYQ